MLALQDRTYREISALMHAAIGLSLGDGKLSLVSSRLASRVQRLGLGGFEELPGAGHAVLLRQAAHHPGTHAQEVHLRELAMADAGTLHRGQHLLHPVLTGDSLRVLDEDLQAPEGHEDSGPDAHCGAGGGQDQRGPDLF